MPVRSLKIFWVGSMYIESVSLSSGQSGGGPTDPLPPLTPPSSSQPTAIKNKIGNFFLAVTPGIRPSDSNVNDQTRISTPTEAIKNGSDYLVIGRPITQSDDPSGALERIIQEIS